MNPVKIVKIIDSLLDRHKYHGILSSKLSVVYTYKGHTVAESIKLADIPELKYDKILSIK